jgi:hypothetical protein
MVREDVADLPDPPDQALGEPFGKRGSVSPAVSIQKSQVRAFRLSERRIA